MNRTFVLGSGFSAALGLPTVRDIFTEIFKLENDERYAEDFPYLKQAIHHLYPHIHLSHGAQSYPPFEEFLSLKYITQDFGETAKTPGQFSEDTWYLFYKSSLRLLTEVITSKESEINYEEDSPLKRFVDALDPTDTIITFNWDNLLEKQLSKSGLPFSLVPSGDSDLLLLKLHGSLSWVKLPYGTKPKNERLFFVLEGDGDLQETLLCTNDFSSPDTWIGLDEPPFIVTPIAHKRPLEKDLMKRIWYQAFSSMVQSDSVAIIGYSLPQEDYHARSLLISGIKASNTRTGNNTHVCYLNPDVVCAARFYAQITSRFEYSQKYFVGDEFSIVSET